MCSPALFLTLENLVKKGEERSVGKADILLCFLSNADKEEMKENKVHNSSWPDYYYILSMKYQGARR